MPYNANIVHRPARVTIGKEVVMPNSDARMVRGLSIAVLVLSILAILGSLLALAVVGIGGVAVTDPSVIAEMERSGAVSGKLNGHSLSGAEAAGLAVLSLGVIAIGTGWLLICAVVSMVAGILGMRNYDKPEKLGAAFGWTIAAAVLAFLSGRIVTTVLLVVCAVYINKLRNPQVNPYGQPQPVYAQPYPQQPYQQPMPAPQPAPVAPQPPMPAQPPAAQPSAPEQQEDSQDKQ